MPAKNKKDNKNNATTVVEPKELPTQLPAYQPIDFSATPTHLEVLHKKMRAVKKKLRRIEEAEKQVGKKKPSPEQERLIAEKGNLSRSLKDFEEIEKSLQKLDLTVPLRLWVGVFFAAAATGDASLNDLSNVLLPPQIPPPQYSPLRELEYACQVVERFLDGDSTELFNPPPITFAQLKEKVVNFLSTPETEIIVSQAVPIEPAPVVEDKKENFVEVPAQEAVPSNVVSQETSEQSSAATSTTESRELPAENKPIENTSAETANPEPSEGQQAPEEVKSESDGTRKRGRGGHRGRGRGYYNRNREEGEGSNYQHRNRNRENGDYNNEGKDGNYKPRGNKNRGGPKTGKPRGSPHTYQKNNQAQGVPSQ